MPMGINQGWYDSNEARRFPLSDNATALATDGVTALPDDFLVDLVVSAPVALTPGSFYISRVRGMGANVVVNIAAGGVDVATFLVPHQHTRFASYAVTSLTAAGVVGRVVIGTEASVGAMAALDASFSASGAPVAVTCVRPRITGVDSFVIRNSDGREFTLTGAVQIVAGRNTSLSIAGQSIAVAVAGGVIYDSKYGCNSDAAGKLGVLAINGVTPDASGNITINGQGCVVVAPGAASLTIRDQCAQPCCGCEELTVIKSGEDSIRDSLNALSVLVSNLGTKIQLLETNFSRSGVPG